MIYRGSRDGFESSKFHDKCDDKPNTLILFNIKSGNSFGGYTEQSLTHMDYLFEIEFRELFEDYTSESNETRSFLERSNNFQINYCISTRRTNNFFL